MGTVGEPSVRRKTRLFAGAVVLAGVLLAGVLYVCVDTVSTWRRASARLAAEAGAAAQTAALAMDASDNAVLRSALEALRTDPIVRTATVRDHAGRVIGSWRDPRGADVTSWTAIQLDLPVEPVGTRHGALHVDADLGGEVLTALGNGLIFVLLACGVAAVLLATMLGFLTRAVWRPLERLLQAIRTARASGETAGRLEVERHKGEFGTLLDEIEGLLQERAASSSSLRAYKSEFERRVRERTQELEAAVAAAREAVVRAESASSAKSDFLARMSHEIRTPLNGVLGMAELLRASPKLDERQQRFAVVIYQSGNALLQLINHILDFSKIEAGKLELEQERFCVREMVEDTLEMLGERAQDKGLELICDVPGVMDTMVFGDCLRLRQVLINLVGNAVKFTHTGNVTVSVRVTPGVETSSFRFEVIDTGIGIAAEACTRIFDAFVQADTSSSRHYGGTGLGLSICKQLVELMRGTIDVSSTVGKGSNFFFSVPLAVDRTAPREKPANVLAATRILIVEDSEAARRMLIEHFQSWGAICKEFDSAKAALAKLRGALSGEFDVLVIDAQLPKTSALDMVGAIRSIDSFADTPLLLMHAGSGDPPPEARQMHGPIAWLNKPIRRMQLRSATERLLGKDDAPAQKAAGQPTARADAPAAASRTSKARRVLVVEDNPVNQEVAVAMLQTLGVESQIASGGKEALEILAATGFDVVLMDCQMPELDGYETARRLRQSELQHGRPRVPVVALTASALSGDAEKCRAAGMDHYVSKPFTVEQLRAVLDTCITPGEKPATPGDKPASTPERRTEPIDAQALDRIRSMGSAGGGDLLARLTTLYASSSEPLIQSLRSAALNGDGQSLQRAAHALKSSSANVGALTLASLCEEVECAARDGRVALAEQLVGRLIGEHQEVMQRLQRQESAA